MLLFSHYLDAVYSYGPLRLPLAIERAVGFEGQDLGQVEQLRAQVNLLTKALGELADQLPEEKQVAFAKVLGLSPGNTPA